MSKFYLETIVELDDARLIKFPLPFEAIVFLMIFDNKRSSNKNTGKVSGPD